MEPEIKPVDISSSQESQLSLVINPSQENDLSEINYNKTSRTEKLIDIKNPVMIIPNSKKIFSGFESISFIREADSSIIGIFWQKNNDTNEYGYLYEIRGQKLQFLKNNKIHKTRMDVTESDVKTFNKLLSLFRNKFREKQQNFSTLANESFFTLRNRDYKKS
jgi:hypothetical protein